MLYNEYINLRYNYVFLGDATDKELVDLVQELEVMKRFGKHKNVINLIGCMTQNGPFYVVVEYARHGNLREFLRKNRPMNNFGSRIMQQNSDDLQLTHKHLVTFAHQIATGMEYLASKQVVLTNTQTDICILYPVFCHWW